MSAFSFDPGTFPLFAQDLEKIAAALLRKERAAVMAGGMAYQADVQRLAPVDTGQYRASIRTDPGDDGDRPVALIGTPMPQARRLEYGFAGPDSLGRVYHQKPRPHWRPPFDQNKERYRDITLSRLR